MLTTRDLIVATIAVTATLGIVNYNKQVPVQKPAPEMMTSRVWEWGSIPAKPTKVGEVRQYFQNPTPTLDELECHVTTLNPGQTPHAPHKHADEELLIIKEGTVESLVNGETKRVGPGSIVFQSSNQLHAIKNVGTTPATYFVIKWNSPGMLKNKQIQ